MPDRNDVPTTGNSGDPVPLAARTNDGASAVFTAAAPAMLTPAAPAKASNLPPGILCIVQPLCAYSMRSSGRQFKRMEETKRNTAVRRSPESFAEDSASARDARDSHSQLPAIAKSQARRQQISRGPHGSLDRTLVLPYACLTSVSGGTPAFASSGWIRHSYTCQQIGTMQAIPRHAMPVTDCRAPVASALAAERRGRARE